jgi:hypothetical protein
MSPTKPDSAHTSTPSKMDPNRPRRGSLPELKTVEKAADKKTPTGPRANPLYKTRLCMNFQSTGSCPYTEKCQFAHGMKELEKWENWRTSHKGDESKAPDMPTDTPAAIRTRSQSLESPSAFPLDDSFSPQSASWDMTTPIKGPALSLDEVTSSSSNSSFSLWSSFAEDIENTTPFRVNARSRSSTYDSTYDNISQLRDAPTLFASPPVISSMVKYQFLK